MSENREPCRFCGSADEICSAEILEVELDRMVSACKKLEAENEALVASLAQMRNAAVLVMNGRTPSNFDEEYYQACDLIDQHQKPPKLEEAPLPEPPRVEE